MASVIFSFFGDLTELLPPANRYGSLVYEITSPVTVKHAVEALGVPHTEVVSILANGSPVSFSYRLQAGANIEVYPPNHLGNSTWEGLLRRPLPLPPRFVVDGHLGRLATHLRLLGFDTLYQHDYDDRELARLSREGQRVLLTRDRRLLMRKQVVYGYCLRSREPREQLEAVLNRYRLVDQINPWRRCLRCNGRLLPVSKDEIYDQLEPKTKRYYHEFHVCDTCRQIYWKGSHFEPLRQFIQSLMKTKPGY